MNLIQYRDNLPLITNTPFETDEGELVPEPSPTIDPNWLFPEQTFASRGILINN